MTARTATAIVIVAYPFRLAGIDGLYPPARYEFETNEELLQSPSFPAYRRVETRTQLPCRVMGIDAIQTVKIDPKALDVALARELASE